MIPIFVAGRRGTNLTEAAMQALAADPRWQVCGFAEDRIDASVVSASGADILLSAGYGYLLDAGTRGAARLGAVGLHPGMLPKYRGSWPLWWALREQEREVGLTLYELGPRFDDGPIIQQIGILIDRHDTFGSLYDRVVQRVPDLMRYLCDAIEASGAIPPGRPQDESQATTFRTPTLRERLEMKVRWAGRAHARSIAIGFATGVAATWTAIAAIRAVVGT